MQSEQITQLLIILILFGSATLVVRAVADAIVRYRALRDGVNQEAIDAALAAERAVMRIRALRLGLLALGEAAALVGIAALQLPANSAGALGALLLGLGVAQLVFFVVTGPARTVSRAQGRPDGTF